MFAHASSLDRARLASASLEQHERSGLVWAPTPVATIAKITHALPPEPQWRDFLDHLRPCSKPLLLWLRGRIWFGAGARAELARAIGSARVALIVDDDLGRGLATALRWMGADVHAFGLDELAEIDLALGLAPGVGQALFERLLR